MKDPRIHISYSDHHFHPDRPRNQKFFYSCSQTAWHLWKCLSENYAGVTYGDAVPHEPIDLLWTQNEHRGFPNVARIAFIATGANAIFNNRQIKAAQRLAGLNDRKMIRRDWRPPRRLWSNFLAVAKSDAVLIKGNARILEGYTRYSAAFSEKFSLINNGIVFERQRSLGPRSDPLSFVYPVTLLCLRKGAHLLAPAWREFAREFPASQLVVLGRDGDYNLRRELRDCPNVEFLGEFQSGDESYLAALNRAKWVIFPSLAEGQAGTLLEAMACGCVPIASRESGIDAEHYGGFVIEPNTSANLLDRLRDAARDHDPDRHERCLARMAAAHDWAGFEQRVLATTQALLARPARPPASTLFIASQFFRHFLAP